MNQLRHHSVLMLLLCVNNIVAQITIPANEKVKAAQETKQVEEKKKTEEALITEKQMVEKKEEAAAVAKKMEEEKKNAQQAAELEKEKAQKAQEAKQVEEKKKAEEAPIAEKQMAEKDKATAAVAKKMEEEKKNAQQAAELEKEKVKEAQEAKQQAEEKMAAQKIEEAKKAEKAEVAQEAEKRAQEESIEEKMAQAKAAAATAAQEIAAEAKRAQEQEGQLTEEPTKEPAKDKGLKTTLAEGIDTLEQEGGNWLLKRQALEKTVDLIEHINNYFTKILEARINFLVKRNKTDHDWDVFINKIGFEVGDVQQLLTNLSDRLEQERKDAGDLTQEERAALVEIDGKIKEVKHLQEQIKIITDLINSLDDVIMQLEEEVNIANTYQANAWKNFQAIKKVLSDERAEELYLQTQGLLKNIQAVDVYLKGKLLEYFNSIIQKTKQGTTTIERSITTLKEKGINLKEEVEAFLHTDKEREEDSSNDDEEEKIAEAIKKIKQEKAKKESAGWLSWISSLWEYPIHLMNQLIDYGMSFFVSTEVAVKKEETSKEVSS